MISLAAVPCSVSFPDVPTTCGAELFSNPGHFAGAPGLGVVVVVGPGIGVWVWVGLAVGLAVGLDVGLAVGLVVGLGDPVPVGAGVGSSHSGGGNGIWSQISGGRTPCACTAL